MSSAALDIGTFAGMRIMESAWLTEPGELTEAWFPLGRSGWKVKRMIVPQIPYRGAIRLDGSTLLMHPATVRELKKQLEATV